MAENYKFLYEQMKHMVTQYQDDIVPGMRKIIDRYKTELNFSRDILFQFINEIEYLNKNSGEKWIDELIQKYRNKLENDV